MKARSKGDVMTHCGTHYDYLVVMMRALLNYANAIRFKELEGQQDGRWGAKYCRREMEIVEELRTMVAALQNAAPWIPPAPTKRKGAKK